MRESYPPAGDDMRSTTFPYRYDVAVAHPPSPAEDVPESEHGIFRERLIDLKSLSWPLRLVVFVAIAQLILVGVALLLRDVPGLPQVTITTSQGGAPITMPTLSFVISFLSMVFVWSFLLTGALRSPWYVRFSVVLLFSLFSLSQIGAAIPGPNASVPVLKQAGEIGALAALVLVLILWGWAAGETVRDRRAVRRGVNRRSSPAFPWITYLVMLGVVVAMFSLTAIFAVMIGHSFDSVPYNFNSLLTLLFFLLYPVFLIAGTDFAEVSEAVAARVGAALRRRPGWLVVALTTLIACVSLGIGVVEVLAQEPTAEAWVILVVFAVLGLLGVALAALGRAFVNWLGYLSRWPARRTPAGAMFIAALVPVVAPFLAIPLLLRGRRRPGSPAALAGLYFSLICTIGLLSVGRLFQWPGVEVMIAAGTLWLIPFMSDARRRPLREQPRESLLLLFQLNLGLLLIVAFFIVFAVSQALSAQSIIILAMLVVFAQLWDLLLSGQQVTNVDGRRFPRSTRVLLYAGYIMLSSTLVLYFASSPDLISQTFGLGPNFDSDTIGQVGLALLGIPLLVTGFMLAISRSPARQRVTVSVE